MAPKPKLQRDVPMSNSKSKDGSKAASKAASQLGSSSSSLKTLQDPDIPRPTNTFLGADGLGAYLSSIESIPKSQYVSHTPDFVTIRDLYPKSSVHLLILPRFAYSRTHPFAAFRDTRFLASCKAEVEKARAIVASELERLYSHVSVSSQARTQALDSLLEGDHDPDVEEKALSELPKGRDWMKEVRAGVHTNPSMNHLHIHVLSRDMYSPCVKHRKHYLSFNSPFFVPMEDFPLWREGDDNGPRDGREDGRPKEEEAEEDNVDYMNERAMDREKRELDTWRLERAPGWHEREMVCWRCGKNFGNKFRRLKEHLEEEWEVWKKL